MAVPVGNLSGPFKGAFEGDIEPYKSCIGSMKFHVFYICISVQMYVCICIHVYAHNVYI